MSDIESRVDALQVWRRGEQRAPHKPLLLLWALARLQRGEPRLASWLEVEPALRRLLEDFGPPRTSHHPEQPFWRMQRDGLWQVTGPDGAEGSFPHGEGRVPTRTTLRTHGAMGGLPAQDHAALAASPDLVNRLVAILLAAHFPSSLHEDLLDAIGLPFVAERRFARRRDPAFRQDVLVGYDYRCAVCDLSLQLDGRVWGVEAAHVKWHAVGGPDEFDNGVALCVLHHKAFDRGAFGLDEERRIVVSRAVSASSGAQAWLLDHHGQPLRPPQDGLPPVKPVYAAWHRREVFRGPGR